MSQGKSSEKFGSEEERKMAHSSVIIIGKKLWEQPKGSSIVEYMHKVLYSHTVEYSHKNNQLQVKTEINLIRC